MSEMLQYIFSTMSDSEKAICQMQKLIKRQKTLNRRSFGLAVIGAGLAVASYIHTKQLQERVDALEETVRSMTEYAEEDIDDEEVQ